MHYAEGSLMMPLALNIIFAQAPKQAPFLVRPLVSIVGGGAEELVHHPTTTRELWRFVDKALEGKKFLVGEQLTGADIMILFPLGGVEATIGYSDIPNIKAWLERVRARPAYIRALAKGAVPSFGSLTT